MHTWNDSNVFHDTNSVRSSIRQILTRYFDKISSEIVQLCCHSELSTWQMRVVNSEKQYHHMCDKFSNFKMFAVKIFETVNSLKRMWYVLATAVFSERMQNAIWICFVTTVNVSSGNQRDIYFEEFRKKIIHGRLFSVIYPGIVIIKKITKEIIIL